MNRSGLLFASSVSRAWRNRLDRKQSRVPSPRKTPPANGLPRWGVAMKTTRRGLGNGLVAEHLPEEPAILGRAGDLLDGLLADRLPERAIRFVAPSSSPECRPGCGRRPPSGRRPRLTIGIEDPTSPPQGPPQQMGREGDGVTACVAERPELVPCSDCRVGLKVFDHPVP